VRGAVNFAAASAAHVRCTWSMQGLKEQNTPSGLKQAAADATTYSQATISQSSGH
jgi:hypothetical protein